MTAPTKQELLDRAGVKDWREMSRVLHRAQGKVARGDELTERESRVWKVATNTKEGT